MKKLKTKSYIFIKRDKNVKIINYGKNTFEPICAPKIKTIDSSLNVCSKCISIFATEISLKNHIELCSVPFLSFYEQKFKDGSILKFAKISSTAKKQALSILGDALILKKTSYFDVENFDFYIVFDQEVKGYYSKYQGNDNSLSCLSVFPPFQKEGLGSLLIDLSQAFCNNTRINDTEVLNNKLYVSNSPERPLSTQGAFCYRKYWKYKVIGGETINKIAQNENLAIEDVVIGLEKNGFDFKTWKLEENILINKPQKLLSKKLRVKQNIK
ncbi:mys-1 [Nucleospora cyclopteri]